MLFWTMSFGFTKNLTFVCKHPPRQRSSRSATTNTERADWRGSAAGGMIHIFPQFKLPTLSANHIELMHVAFGTVTGANWAKDYDPVDIMNECSANGTRYPREDVYRFRDSMDVDGN